MCDQSLLNVDQTVVDGNRTLVLFAYDGVNLAA